MPKGLRAFVGCCLLVLVACASPPPLTQEQKDALTGDYCWKAPVIRDSGPDAVVECLRDHRAFMQQLDETTARARDRLMANMPGGG